MIAVITASRIEGSQIVAYKGTAQGETFDKLLKSAETLGANTIVNTCFDNALDVDTLFHSAAVVIEPIPSASTQNAYSLNEGHANTSYEDSEA